MSMPSLSQLFKAVGKILNGNAHGTHAPVLVGGSDGTNARTIKTDTSGNQIAVGAAAAGSAISGNPVLMGGSDGTNARAFKTDTTGNQLIGGDIAHGSADSGNPLSTAFQARTTNPTAVSDGQRVRATADKLGRQVVVAGQVRDLVADQTTTITVNTETTIATAVASTFLDITTLVITNSSSTAVSCTLKESTGGTTRAIFDIAANGGIVIPYTRPLKQGTVNNNWTLTVSSAVSSIHVFVQFEKNI